MYIADSRMEIKTEAVGDNITECPSTASMYNFTADKFCVLYYFVFVPCVCGEFLVCY